MVRRACEQIRVRFNLLYYSHVQWNDFVIYTERTRACSIGEKITQKS